LKVGADEPIAVAELTVDAAEAAADARRDQRVLRLTSVIGAPATSTARLLAELARVVVAGASEYATVVVLDPLGRIEPLICPRTRFDARLVIVHEQASEDLGLGRGLAELDGAGDGSALIIDQTHCYTRAPRVHECLTEYLFGARGSGHRVVLQLHAPDDAPVGGGVPPLDWGLSYVFATLEHRGEWVRWQPELASTGAFDGASGLCECVAVAGRRVVGVLEFEPDGRS